MTAEPASTYSFHLSNLPHTEGETDTARYICAFDHMWGEAPLTTADEHWIAKAAKDAIRFGADDAFRRGFESCHTNVVAPLRDNTITIRDAEDALRQYGERVRNGIAMLFEDGPGVPTQLSEEIYELPLPPTNGIFE